MKFPLPKSIAVALLGLCMPLAAWSGEGTVQAQLLAGLRSEAGVSFRHTARWGLYGEAGGGLLWLFVADANAESDPLREVWALAPRLEVGQQLVRQGAWGSEIYLGTMPWGYILDNTKGCCSQFENSQLHWEPWQGYVGLRATWTRLPPSLQYWQLGAYGEIGYTRITIDSAEVSAPATRVASGAKFRLGLQAKWGVRLGHQPIERSLAWAVRSVVQDSTRYQSEKRRQGLADPDPAVRIEALSMFGHEGELADFLVLEKDSTVRAAGIALIKDPWLRRYVQEVPQR